MKIKKIIFLTLIISVLSLTGCASKTEYNSFRKEVNSLYEKIVSTDAIINNIDVNSETSTDELFESLDNLKTSFDDFSKVKTPEEFKDCTYLSENASKYLSNAEASFHKAFDGEYDDDSFKEGIANYNEVIKCVNYMGDVLQKNQK